MKGKGFRPVGHEKAGEVLYWYPVLRWGREKTSRPSGRPSRKGRRKGRIPPPAAVDGGGGGFFFLGGGK